MFIKTRSMLTKFCLCGIIFLMFLTITQGLYSARYRTIKARLRGKTQLWKQLRKSNGYPTGCGNNAWAIVFAYWKQYRGKTRLLPGVSMTNGMSGSSGHKLIDAQNEIARYCKTKFGSYRGNKYGRSYPRRMCRAKKYATRRGYRATCRRVRGREFKKFNKVRKWLRANRPVILLINNPSRAFTTLHYVVIERAEKRQRKRFRKWRDRSVRYYVNMGNGKRKWIWVREKGRNRHKRTGSYSMFFLDIK
jgi:hypothetical protein